MSAVPQTMATPSRFKTAKASRATALALFALALLLVIAALAVPAWWLFDRYESAAALMARQLQSYTSLNQLRPTLVQSVEALKAKDTKKYFVKGATAALAGADLQDIAKTVIEANNGRVLSSQLLPHKDDVRYRQVNATIQMTANIQNLRQILYALETREPYLFLDNLTVRAQVPSGFKPQPGFEPEMFVQVDVSAIMPLAPPAPTAATGTSKATAKPAAAKVTSTNAAPAADPGAKS